MGDASSKNHGCGPPFTNTDTAALKASIELETKQIGIEAESESESDEMELVVVETDELGSEAAEAAVSAAASVAPIAGKENVLSPRMLAKKNRKMERIQRTISKHTGEILHTISADSLTPVAANIAWDQAPELICCYNWQDSADGTNAIFVPGEPPKWAPRSLPHTLPLDDGWKYTDYNYARQPRDPYAPMFHALGAMNPSVQFMDVDVIADRNNLRTLLEFVQGKYTSPFRLDLYSVFNTLILVRKETGFWKRADGIGLGANFEKAFTRPASGMENATSHYRAIRYRMVHSM